MKAKANGVDIEVDINSWKKVDAIAVGDNVVVYVNKHDYYSKLNGIVTGIERYHENAIIVVAAIEKDCDGLPNINFIRVSDGDGSEVVKANDEELYMQKSSVVDVFEEEICKRQREAAEIQDRLNYFKEHFCRSVNKI